MQTFTRTHVADTRGTSTYTGEDGTVLYLPKSRKVHPESFPAELEFQEKVKPEPKAPALSKEERAAIKAAMTPADKIQAAKERAQKALDKANALAAKLNAPTEGGDAASA